MRVPKDGPAEAHFRPLVRLHPALFVLRIWMESIFASTIAVIAVRWFIDAPRRDELDDSHPLFDIIGVPIYETLALQALPIWIAQRFTRNTRVLILVAWLPFALLHFLNGAESGIAAGGVAGFYIAFSYAVWAKRSHPRAFCITATVHALYNAVAILLA